MKMCVCVSSLSLSESQRRQGAVALRFARRTAGGSVDWGFALDASPQPDQGLEETGRRAKASKELEVSIVEQR